jgi:murein L,D-transpeptidase YafK
MKGLVAAIAAVAALPALSAMPANAVSIELRDVAADRIERQRRAAEGNLPLPDTPDLGRFAERLAEKGMKAGAPILIRIFKAESELEVWMQKDGRYELFSTYPICHWSGTLGPKLRSGDKQAPEGFYTVTHRQLHRIGRWPRSLNLGFPNVFDKVQSRTGSYILVHGGCSSVGCYAMTNTVIEEIYSLTEAAIGAGEEHVPVHVFPFRMTGENLARHGQSEWRDFWFNLKEGYDSFERTRKPPQVSVCQTRYYFRDAAPEEVGEPGPLGWCGATAAAIRDLERLSKLAMLRPSSWLRPDLSRRLSSLQSRLRDLKSRNIALTSPPTQAMREAIMSLEPRGEPQRRRGAQPTRAASATAPSPQLPCSLNLPSCRRYADLQQKMARRAAAVAKASASKRTRTASRH